MKDKLGNLLCIGDNIQKRIECFTAFGKVKDIDQDNHMLTCIFEEPFGEIVMYGVCFSDIVKIYI